MIKLLHGIKRKRLKIHDLLNVDINLYCTEGQQKVTRMTHYYKKQHTTVNIYHTFLDINLANKSMIVMT